MATVFDVAQYILAERGPMSAMKLQKLVYYSQAWAVVWNDDVLFPERIRAWRNGPVVPELWDAHRGQFRVTVIPQGDPGQVDDHEKAMVDDVLAFYGDKDAQWLSDLTHMEDPWKDAWDGGRGQNREITPEALSEYYSTIEPGGAAE